MAKVLVIGSGGREDTLIWKLRRNQYVDKAFYSPGNGGIAEMAEVIDINDHNFNGLANFAEDNNIDLTVIGPEDPLVNGIVDYFQERGLRIFGPNKEAAKLEGSKVFAKQFMAKYGIPTADFEVFDKPIDAQVYTDKYKNPLVIKADGLAAGKGAIVCDTAIEQMKAIKEIMIDKVFGIAGNKIVIEEKLVGEEASILVICDGENYVCLASSQDHKPVYETEEDKLRLEAIIKEKLSKKIGDNTGGMGAYAPAPIITLEMQSKIEKEIIKPTLQGIAKEGMPYKGCLYIGLMITKDGPKVLEYNCRFGDPETQPVLMLLENDFYDLLNRSIDGALGEVQVKNKQGAACCVVMASGGYPYSKHIQKGKIITLPSLIGLEDGHIAFAGVKKDGGNLVTSGGRILGVTMYGKDIRDAIEKAYTLIEEIDFERKYYRNDIGQRALRR